MADDAAPYRPPGRKDSSPKGRGGNSTRGKGGRPKSSLQSIATLREKLKGTVTMVGMGVYKYNKVDGVILMGAAPDLVDSYCDLAENNIYVHRVLDRIASVDDKAGVLLPTANVVAAMMKNHGMYDGPLLVSIAEYENRALNNPEVTLDPEEGYDETADSDLDDSPQP